MPKSTSNARSPRQTPYSNSRPNGDPNAPISDRDTEALKKKKNADAQAAFRARRANYIATLEETVTTLEAVVNQLQEASREVRADLADEREANTKLHQQLRERENFWRTQWASRRNTHFSDSDDHVSPIPSSSSSSSQQTPMTETNSYIPQGNHPNEETAYRIHQANNPQCDAPYSLFTHHGTPSRPLSYAETAHQQVEAPSSAAHGSVPISIHSHYEHQWHHGLSHSSSLVDFSANGMTRPIQTVDVSSHSLPSSTSQARYPAEFTMKANQLSFLPNRSISPSATPPSLTSAVQNTRVCHSDLSFSDSYSHYPHPHEMILHNNGISSFSQPSIKYLGLVGQPAGAYSTDQSHHYDTVTSTGVSQNPHPGSLCSSRSPSPDGSRPVTETVAVIKAAAFGALRRSRARTKKSRDEAAAVMIDVLDATIGPGIARIRPHHPQDDASD